MAREEKRSPKKPGRADAGKNSVGKVKVNYSNGLGWSEDSQSWWIHIRIGKKTYTRDTGKRYLKDAEIWLLNFRRQRELELRAGALPDLTVEEGLRAWEENVALECMRTRPPSSAHIKRVVSSYEKWVLPHIGSKVVADLDRKDLVEVITNFRKKPGPHGPHTEGGVRNFIINLNIPLRWLYKTERTVRIPRLPMIPKIERKIPATVPAEKFPILLERYDKLVQYDVYAQLYIRMMALVGLRTSNARDLTKDKFTSDLSAFGTGITKNGHEYHLPLPEDVQALLKVIPNMGSAEPLFPDQYGKGVRGGGWCAAALRRAAKDSGIPLKGQWHVLRRTYASALVEMGANPFVLMTLMGWETIAIALRYVATRIEVLSKTQKMAADHLLGKDAGPNAAKAGIEEAAAWGFGN